MSTSETINNKMANMKPTKVVIPKVWKRPHSTIYGKNVEFGSKLTSDKLGEINGRKFNSELPWQIRNSGASSSTSGSSVSQGYLSKLLNEPQSTLIGSVITSTPPSGANRYPVSSSSAASAYNLEDRERLLTPNSCTNYADVLELTNPNRYSRRRASIAASALDRSRLRTMHDDSKQQTMTTAAARANRDRTRRIDFYESYLDDFNEEIRKMNESSRMLNDPLMQRRALSKYLDFNYQLGLFVPTGSSSSEDERSLMRKKTLREISDNNNNNNNEYLYQAPSYAGSYGDDTSRPTGVAMGHQHQQQQQSLRHHQRRPSFEHQTDINPAHFNPVITTTKQTHLLPKHACQLAASPYGQSADGRKLSLGSINPHSYRPSLPHKTTTVHSTDGEEFEFQDKSSPFYTDRWAGRTIRHFDSDLYSNANLFKSMIL